MQDLSVQIILYRKQCQKCVLHLLHPCNLDILLILFKFNQKHSAATDNNQFMVRVQSMWEQNFRHIIDVISCVTIQITKKVFHFTQQLTMGIAISHQPSHL